MISRDRIPLRRLLLAFVLDGAGWRRQCRQLTAGDQYCRLSCSDIDVIQLAVVPGIVALHKRDLGSVGTPLHVLRAAAQNSARLIHVLDGQLFLPLRRLCGRCGGLCGE